MVQTEQVQSTTTITSATSGAVPGAVEVIKNEPIMKTIHEAPVVENIIEKKNIEIHNRNVVKEVHEQPIIEIERRAEVKYVEQQAVQNKVVAPTKYEEIGERTLPNVALPIQTQGNVVPIVENSVVEKTLPPIIEKVIEQPVYKQVIIEQHEIPVQTVYTTVPVIHAQQQETVLEQNTFQFRQMNTELSGIQTQTVQQQPLLQQQQQVFTQQTVQQPLLQQSTLQQGANLDRLRLVRSGYGKSVWGLTYGNELFRMSRQRKLGMMWERFAFWEGATTGFRFQDFSVIKGGYLWLLGLEDRMLYLLDPSTRHEGMLRPMLQNTMGLPRFTHISGYDSTHCYMLGEDGSVYLYDNGRLLRLNGQLKSLSSGNPKRFFGKSFELWGISFDNRAMRWNGVDSWLDTGLLVRDIAVGVDNSVYAIDANGQLLKWIHNANRFEAVRTKFANNTGATPMQFQGVSAFKEHRGVYTVDNVGNVYEMDV